MSKPNISAHITYKEATRSNTATRRGIKNVPNAKQLEAMKALAEQVFEPLRSHFNKPIRVNSFFRSIALNKAIGGSSTSQHCKGEAVDLDATSGFTNKQIYDYIRDNLEFDQLIWEFGTDAEPDWVHVSFRADSANRKQQLRASRKGGKSVYQVI
ncbi:MAG: peptidase M15 [Flavobacteriales bacterium]|nr:peptidase M15 [Flavobacteriales bacterium]